MKLLRITVAALATALCALNIQAQSISEEFDSIYDPAAKMVRENANLMYRGTVIPVWQDADSFVYVTNEESGKKYYEVRVSDRSRKEISEEYFKAKSAREERQRPEGWRRPELRTLPSPDGKHEIVFRDNNIWVRESGAEGNGTQLSFDGTDNDSYTLAFWSPDSRKIAAYRREVMKERQILLRMSRPETQVQPEYRWLDYAKPGDALPQSAPALFDIEKGRIEFDTAAYPDQYELSHGAWSSDSKYFTFEYNKRGHQLYQLVAVDAQTGENRVLAEEKTDTFVYYNDIYRYYFDDGKTILWTSERDDWRHLYMIDATDGSIRQVTKGPWNVREVQHVDEEAGTVLMYVNGYGTNRGEDPYNKHLVSLDLKSGRITDLTPENANHSVSFNSDWSCFVDNYSRPDLPGTAVLRSSADGSKIMDIQKTDISKLLEKGFTMPAVFSAKGRDGKTDIWGTIFFPYNYDKNKKYPVVEYIYAGPHDSHVVKDFSVYTRNAQLQELGFIVVTIDGMGTDNRSKSFQDVCYRNLKDAGFPDRILWMQAAAKKYKSLDLSNVGIYGYSAGGQNTLAALLFHPEFYKVGVALCGCHDNRMDKIWWNEQWMGYPIGPWYGENSNVDNAWRLEGKLFIINGEIDDNVDPASSLQVASELIKHNKHFEQLYLPGFTHNLGSEYITKTMFEFFYRNIKKSQK